MIETRRLKNVVILLNAFITSQFSYVPGVWSGCFPRYTISSLFRNSAYVFPTSFNESSFHFWGGYAMILVSNLALSSIICVSNHAFVQIKLKVHIITPTLLKLVPKFTSTRNSTGISVQCVDT